MFRVFNCLSVEHDWRLVVLAGLVCFLASVVAISLFHRARATRGQTRVAWLGLAGAAAGCGIWATHFIAMLAYDPGVPIAYDIPLTALSLVAAAIVTCAGLSVAVYGSSRWVAPVGGGVVGGGVACMHYTGMWAVVLPGHVTWIPNLVFLSIVLGMLFGTAALAIAVRREDVRATFISALLLTLAIVSHHFTAMGAVEIIPDPGRLIAPFTLSPTALAIAVAGVAVAVLGMCLIGAIADRRLATKTNEFARDRLHLIETSEEKLREQHLRLDAALNNMPQGLSMFDASARLTMCNQRYLEMYGIPQEIGRAGRTIHELMNYHVATGTLTGDPNQRADELVRAAHEGRNTNNLVETRDSRAISISTRPMPGGGWVATHDDITERQRAEKELARSQALANTFALLEATLENVNQGIMMIDANGRMPICNRRAAELLELPAELTASSPSFDEVLEHVRKRGEFESADDATDIWNRTSRIDGAYQSFQLKRSNGMVLEIRSVPLADGGMVCTFTDVSELLKKERLSILGQLTATVAHELRNPLSAIRNTLPVIRELASGKEAELNRPMSRIERSIGRCDQLVTGLLDYTRPAVLNCKPTDIDLWLDGILDEQNIPHGIALERKFSAPNRILYLDTERFRRVIINLIDNATQAITQNATCTADRKVIVATTASDQVKITIQDTGPGIADNILPKIFDPLFSTKNFGTGLGLPTVKQLVEQHGGTVSIDSALGRGTSAVISLPLSSRQQVAA